MSFSAGWYPVALSNQLEPGTAAGTRLFDRELCIWRDTKGDAHAWEDRCPHRGMRLSFGFVRGDRIACLYHGWQYNTQGQCRLIPAHPDLDVPPKIRVATYPCIERLDMVWVYSDAHAAPPLDLAVEPREVVAVRSLYIDCAPRMAMAALAARSEDIGSGGVILLSIDAAGQPLLAGVQPFGEAKTALHLVLPGRRDERSGLAQREALIWAEELRNELESKLTPNEAPTRLAEVAP
jgi:nitrite reductase/ring-hydroxylating ferredoxin subunit